MLAAIGVIINAQQIPVALGVSGSGVPIARLRKIPEFMAAANPAIAAIGTASMFLWSLAGQRFALLKLFPLTTHCTFCSRTEGSVL